MKNEHHKFIKNKKYYQLSRTNKSSIEGNKTTISNVIRNSFDNNFYIYSKKIINKNLKQKYNITPEKHTLMSVQNFIDAKYCHEIAVFKEKLIYNYEEEFLKRIYNTKEAYLRIPKFVVYYTNYLLFFCRPIFQELNLDEQLQKYYEKKAQVFYHNNYSLINNKDNKDKININQDNIIFTPKIRKLISTENSSSHLTIKKIENNSFNTIYSFENSIIKILNETKHNENNKKLNETNKQKLILKISNNSKIKINSKEKEKKKEKEKEKEKNYVKIVSSVKEEKKAKSKLDNKSNVPLYKKHSRNLVFNNPLYTEENTFSNRKREYNQILDSKHSKIFSSQNNNFPICLTERNDIINKKKYIIPPLKNQNIIKKRTTSFSLRSSSLNNNKRKNQKLFSHVIITPSKNDNNNINPYKTIYNFTSGKIKSNFTLKNKVNIKNNKLISGKRFNQIKDYIEFQKNIIKFKKP